MKALPATFVLQELLCNSYGLQYRQLQLGFQGWSSISKIDQETEDEIPRGPHAC